MGGIGSGSWYRCSTKPTTDNFHRWDIKKLIKEGALKEGQYNSGGWQWYEERYGKKTVISTIRYIIDASGSSSYAQVKYKNKNSQESFDYKIHLATTNPNYGGKRWWFICPIAGCGKRVGVLYMGSKYFACRHCYNVAYPSQNEPQHYRMLRKAQAIHMRLGGSGCTDEWVRKPKYMHQKTFDRLINEMEHCEQISLVGMAAKFGILDRI